MARDCDVLMVICPRAATGALSAEVLRPWGHGARSSMSRGSVVTNQADGSLGAAGLDVFESEPNVPEALLGMDQVVLQPHVASATHETRMAMGVLAADNLRAHFSGRPVLTPVG
jgi:lactate dehydrogenase-like 2-hydroxyacid dehydrogenase